VSFCGASLVARFQGYRFESFAEWSKMEKATVENTDAKEWQAICEDVAGAGFRAIEIWEAHASPQRLTSKGVAMEWKRIMDEAGLKPVAYAGRLLPETLRICQWLEIPHVDQGFPNMSPDEATKLCQEYGVRFNLENHYQKSTAEMLEQIGGGNEWLGMCVDTGWLGTQGLPGPEVIAELGELVRHTHIKDVKAVGGHATCLLGEGVVDPAACIRTLKEIGYDGWYSWEDEPEDRNPLDSAERNRLWIEKHVST
jgi:sugar phosphate isomerase/epimerase